MANLKKLKTQIAFTEIKRRKLAELMPYKRNPRRHDDQQIKVLAASMIKFGFTQPIVIDEYSNILAGHGRYEASKHLGLDTVPVIVLRGLSKVEKRAYRIADNRIGELAVWTFEELAFEVDAILKSDFDIESTGFTTAYVDNLLQSYGPISLGNSEDFLPEVSDTAPVSKPGDLWILGNSHYLLCGSALNRASYKIVLRDELAQAIIADAPYNVRVKGHIRCNKSSGHEEFMMASGEMTQEEFTIFLHTFMKHTKRSSVDGSIHYIFMDWRHMKEVIDASLPVYGPPKQLIVWNKDNGGMGTFYRNKHELVFVFKHGIAPHINNFKMGETGRYRTNVWDYAGVNTMKKNRAEELAMHPTVKPVSMIADAIRDCSKHGGIILDPFCGSGTTIIAAEQTGRVACCIEIDPKYVDVAIERYMRVTGKPVELVNNGKSYERIKKIRQKKREMENEQQ